MAENTKIYWKGLEELTNETEFVKNAHKEFGDMPEPSAEGNSLENLSTHRRDFLKVMGFSVAAASLAACEAPVKKAIPLLNKPEEYDPSVANWYASTYTEGGDYVSVLVKTREGRPIKIEGNKLSSVTKGGTNARAQASVLSLYDTTRYKTAQKDGKEITWEALDKEVGAKLAEIAAAGGAIRIVSNTILSPTTKKAIAAFKAKYPSTEHVVYDANSAYGILKANELNFGKYAIPAYRFDKADIIVSFGADFLGTWISPVEYAKQFSINRKLGKGKKSMSRLYAIESLLSLTGSNADKRLPIKPSEEGLYVAALYNKIAEATGAATVSVPAGKDLDFVKAAATDLLAAKGKSLVVSGSNDVKVQQLVNGINQMLGNYGQTIDLNTVSYARQGNDEVMNKFVEDLKGGAVAAVLFYGANPVYDHPKGKDIEASLGKAKLTLSFADRPDETTAKVSYVAPDSHFLESWGDAEPKTGHFSLQQPAISKLFKTRQAQESLLLWAGEDTDYYTYLKNNWQASLFGTQNEHSSFRDFWNYSLHDGVYEIGKPSFRKSVNTEVAKDSAGNPIASAPVAVAAPVSASQPSYTSANWSEVATSVAQTYKVGSGIDLVVYEKIGLGTGVQANNPWLMEMPDPVSRACWENYVTIPLSYAKKEGIKVVEGDTVLLEVSINGQTVKAPAIVMPGQAADTIGIAYGYGRTVTGLAGKDKGVNAFPLVASKNGGLLYWSSGATVKNTGDKTRVAHVQTHHTVMDRDIIQSASLAAYQANPQAGRKFHTLETANGKVPTTDVSLWLSTTDKNSTPGVEYKAKADDNLVHNYKNHAWGMVIDLNSCIGCGACVIGCQAENNVPVVGKEEVLMRREMHWIRIDRYFSSESADNLEQAAENPTVTFQPMMCQHCNNAPCETVCPVVATTHSSEGLNQMTYNRCIGTRYCANNCPFKVRRFNWFSYPQNNDRFPENYAANSDLGRMVLNPDVTVRARGVMEKCSMCVQRIQEGKLVAKKEKRRPVDGEITTACASACPTDAIVFGDLNDADSAIYKLVYEEHDKRAYHVLEEINVRPQVAYLSKIRNVEEKVATSEPVAKH